MTQYTPPQMQPQSLNYAQPVRNDLRYIATRQKGIILCILAQIVLIVLRFASPPPVALILALASFAVSIVGTVFVFMLAMRLYSTGTGIVLGILTLIPLIGLIVLLVVNGKATNVLKQNRIHVGLLGARMSEVPESAPL